MGAWGDKDNLAPNREYLFVISKNTKVELKRELHCESVDLYYLVLMPLLLTNTVYIMMSPCFGDHWSKAAWANTVSTSAF